MWCTVTSQAKATVRRHLVTYCVSAGVCICGSQKTTCNLLIVFLQADLHVSHCVYAGVRRQLVIYCVSAGGFTRVPLCCMHGSQKTPCGSQLSLSTTQGWNSAVRLGVQCLYPLNSLAGPSLVYACMILPPCIFLNIICILKFMPYYMTVLPVCMVLAEIKRECRGPWNWS